MLFWQFSNVIIYVKIVGKIPDQHLNVWLISNPGDKVQKRWRTTGQIRPALSTRIWTLSPGLENSHTLKYWSGIFPTIFTYIIMLENCQNNISVYGCSQIQGTIFYSCWNLMKPGSQSGTSAKLNIVYCWNFYAPILKKSRIRETKHLSTDADSSTDAIGGWTKNTPKPMFFEKLKKSSKTQKLKNV